MGKKSIILTGSIMAGILLITGFFGGITIAEGRQQAYQSQTIENLALQDVRTGEIISFETQEVFGGLVLKNEEGRILFWEKNKNGSYLIGSLLVGDKLITQEVTVQGKASQKECYDLALWNKKDGSRYPISEHTTFLQIDDVGVFFSHHMVETTEGKEAFRLEMIIFSCGLREKSIKSK